MLKSTMQRRFVTLIEMLIVMFLIALITGIVAYNYRGSLDEGKAFKTKVGIEKLRTILDLEVAKHPDRRNEIISDWQTIVKASPIVHDANALIKDGWGEVYEVSDNPSTGNIDIRSRKYEAYQEAHPTSLNN